MFSSTRRVREDREPDGSVEWNLEFGMSTLSLPAPPGESCLLLLQDEPGARGAPTALATATRARVLGSLRCTQRP